MEEFFIASAMMTMFIIALFWGAPLALIPMPLVITAAIFPIMVVVGIVAVIVKK